MLISALVVQHSLLKIKHHVNSRATFVYVPVAFVSVLLGYALHCQGNALFAGIDTEHLDPHDIADLQHFPRVLDEFIADLGNMDQPVLVDTQVYECAEINDVAET